MTTERTSKTCGQWPATASGTPHLEPLSPEATLVVRCATTVRATTGRGTDSGHRDRVHGLVEAGPDWDRVLAIARANDVAPLLSEQLAQCEADVPEAVLSSLRDSHRRSSMQSMHLAGELLAIVDDFDSAGIPVLPFKGPTLARSAYGDLALRSFRDVDLLVPRSELSRAVDRLESRGYEWSDGVPRHDDAAVLGGPYTPPLASEFRLSRGSTTVELRWQVGEPSRPLDVDFETLWERRTSLSLAERTVPALSPEDRLVVLAYHGVKHRWDRLKWVCDVAEAIHAGGFDWDATLERARATGARRKLLIAVALAVALFEAAVPERVERELDSDARATALAAEFLEAFAADPLAASDRRDRTRYNALASDSVRDVLASVFYTPWFQPRLDDYRLFPLPGVLHPLYYPLHAGRGVAVLTSGAVDRLRTRLGGGRSPRRG